MTTNFKPMDLLAVMLLVFLSSFTAAGTKENSTPAPEATAAEAGLSFRDIPYLDKSFIDVAPGYRKDALVVGELGVDGGNKGMIVELAREIANGDHGKFDSMLIAHKGKLLFESYYLRGRINLPHPQASATKAYTGLALGRAIQLGYLTMADLDRPLVSFLKELNPKNFVKGAERITLNHALTMRGGLLISEDKWKKVEENPDALKGQGLVQALLEQSGPITLESQRFEYGNFNPDLVMQVIEAVVPGTAEDFIKNEFLNKLGITNYAWSTNPNSGLPQAGSRASMTSRDMVKLGTLAMNKGKWNGEQLLPEAFISKAIDRLVDTSDEEFHYGGKDTFNQGYGYFWWSADMRHGDKSYFSSSAQGGYGQQIILLKELDLQVVFTGHDNDTNYLQIVAERILPAFVQ
ncbi:serine hydrolase domain-containing protein [Microbulbifer sp. TYP-18]|uniref:serine hydrolase domain-containing protein n=1 Tax=Microbulbifer sp. TYP-18 TaxID=3230024 RepID=UPI0034C63284